MLKTVVKSLRFFRFFAQSFPKFRHAQQWKSDLGLIPNSQGSLFHSRNDPTCTGVGAFVRRKEHLCCFPGMDSTWQKVSAGRALFHRQSCDPTWNILKLLRPWFFYFFLLSKNLNTRTKVSFSFNVLFFRVSFPVFGPIFEHFFGPVSLMFFSFLQPASGRSMTAR